MVDDLRIRGERPAAASGLEVLTVMSPDLLPPIVYTLEPRIALWSVVLSLTISLGVVLVFGV